MVKWDVPCGYAVTVWKDGTWKVWTVTDAYCSRNDPNYLCDFDVFGLLGLVKVISERDRPCEKELSRDHDQQEIMETRELYDQLNAIDWARKRLSESSTSGRTSSNVVGKQVIGCDYEAEARKVWYSYGLAKPSPDVSEEEFVRVLASDWKQFGVAFVYKVRNPSGSLVEVYLLRPYSVVFTVSKAGEFYGVSHLTCNSPPYKNLFLPASDVDKLLSPTVVIEYSGSSPLSSARKYLEAVELLEHQIIRRGVTKSPEPDHVVNG